MAEESRPTSGLDNLPASSRTSRRRSCSSSSTSSSDGSPNRKRRKQDTSLERRFEILSQQLVSHVNNILCANFTSQSAYDLHPLTSMQIPCSNTNTGASTSTENQDNSFLRLPTTENCFNSIANLEVSVKEPPIAQANPDHVTKITSMQRFDTCNWNAVRYTDAQKKYVAYPAFIDLKINEELRRFEDPSTPICLSQMGRTFAALSNAFLTQYYSVNIALQAVIDWSAKSDTDLSPSSIYNKLRELFGNASNYQLVSQDALQIMCGKRAEIIELGHLNFATFITHRGRLHCRILQRHSKHLQIPTYEENFLNKSERPVGMVDKKYLTDIKDSSKSKTDQLPDHRRVRHTMGRCPEQQEDLRYLGESPKKLALQSKGDVRSNCGLVGRSTLSQRLGNNTTERQQDSGYLHKERRRNTIAEATRIDQRPVSSGRRSQRSPSPPLPSRSIQRGGRSTIQRPKRCRMAPAKRSHRRDLQTLGNPRHRSLCVDNRTCCSQLCLSRLVRLERLLSRRFQHLLAIRPCLDISASSSSITSSQYCLGAIHNNSSHLDKTVLASRSQEPSNCASQKDTQPRVKSSEHEDRPLPTSNQKHKAGSLAHFGWDSLTDNWTLQEKSLLISCWRESTLKTYSPIWNKWCRWCQANNINSRKPSPSNVAQYLAYLHITEKLAYRTLLVYKSVVASVCETVSDIKISSSPIVKHILKAESLSKPSKVKAPIWDVRALIKYLKDTNPNPNHFYEVSRRTAVILLLVSGRRVHDLTLLRCDVNSFIDNWVSITLHPEFGSKTDSASHRQVSWRLIPADNQKVDPIFWLRNLLSLTRDIRGTTNNLFIRTRPPFKPASPTIIGGWVKKVLSEAGIEASPGSFKTAVSSLNWIENYPINEILSKANWKHETTFRKYYERHARDSTENCISEKFLSNFFSTI